MRYLLCCLGLFALSLPARAGELDNEKAPVRPAAAKATAPVLAKAGTASEMDKEAPQQSWRCCHGGWGCGHGCFGGFCCRSCFCFRPCFSCYPSFCCAQPYYGGCYGGGYYGF
jgi:hypothetical protein